MGLLSQILGGLAGNAMGRSPVGRGGMGGMGGGALIALMPIVLGMLSKRQGGGLGGGGLGGLGGSPGLGGLGGSAGMGGLGGLLEQFTRKGYGNQAQSWVGTGANEPLTPEAVGDVFGDEQISQIAQQAGISDIDARTGLSELLPEVVDHFTPDGQVPASDHFESSLGDFERQFQGRST